MPVPFKAPSCVCNPGMNAMLTAAPDPDDDTTGLFICDRSVATCVTRPPDCKYGLLSNG